MNETILSNITHQIEFLTRKLKIYSAVIDMGSKVRMNEDHVYKTTDNGTWLQGVSSVSNIVPKDWLSAWGAKEAVKFLGYSDYEGDHTRALEVMEIISKMESELDEEGTAPIKGKTAADKFIAFLKEAKGASARKSKTALVDGKKGHTWLEEHVKALIEGKKDIKVPTDTLKRPIEQFLEWEKDNIDHWILSEALVANPALGYAGTLDAIAVMKTGKLALIDFKFASHISEDYYLQTAAYQATFEPYEIQIDERIIIRLPKTLLKEEWNEKEKKYEMVENNIEVQPVKTNYEADKIAFLHALPLKGWINQFTKK